MQLNNKCNYNKNKENINQKQPQISCLNLLKNSPSKKLITTKNNYYESVIKKRMISSLKNKSHYKQYLTNTVIIQRSDYLQEKQFKTSSSTIFIPVYTKIKLNAFNNIQLSRLNAELYSQIKICFNIKNLKKYIIQQYPQKGQQIYDRIYTVLTQKVRLSFNKDPDILLDAVKQSNSLQFQQIEQFQESLLPSNNNTDENSLDEQKKYYQKKYLYYTLWKKINFQVKPKNYILAPFEQLLLKLTMTLKLMDKIQIMYKNKEGILQKHKFFIKFNCLEANNLYDNIDYNSQEIRFGVYKISKNNFKFQTFNRQYNKQTYSSIKIKQRQNLDILRILSSQDKNLNAHSKQSKNYFNETVKSKIKDNDLQRYIDQAEAFLYEERNDSISEKQIIQSLSLIGLQDILKYKQQQQQQFNFQRNAQQFIQQVGYFFDQDQQTKKKISYQDLKMLLTKRIQQLNSKNNYNNNKQNEDKFIKSYIDNQRIQQIIWLLTNILSKFIKAPTQYKCLGFINSSNIQNNQNYREALYQYRIRDLLNKYCGKFQKQNISFHDLLFLLINIGIVFYIEKIMQIDTKYLLKQSKQGNIQFSINDQLKSLIRKAVFMNTQPEFRQFKYIHVQIQVYKEPFEDITSTFFTLFLLNLVNLFNFWNGPQLSKTLPIFASSLIAFSALLPTIRRSHTPSRIPMNIYQILVWVSMIPTILKLVHSLVIRNQDPKTYTFDPWTNVWFIISVGIIILVVVIVLGIYLLYRFTWKNKYDYQPLMQLSIPFENIDKSRWKNDLCDQYFYNHTKIFNRVGQNSVDFMKKNINEETSQKKISKKKFQHQTIFLNQLNQSSNKYEQKLYSGIFQSKSKIILIKTAKKDLQEISL